MRSSFIVVALSAFGLIAATDSTAPVLRSVDRSFELSAESSLVGRTATRDHPEISKRQAGKGKKASRYSTVVAKSPFKLNSRDSLNSPSVPVPVKLAVSTSDGSSLLGYIAPSTNFIGDYTYVSNPASATVFSLTLATTDVQNLPIINPPANPFLAGVAGASNAGFDSPPFIPSSNFGDDQSPDGKNYAYMSDAQSVPYGRARPGTASDKSTTYVETGMFQLSGVGLRKLVPVWVNVDGTVVPNQKFGLDSSNNLIMYGSQSAVDSAYGGTITQVSITYVI